MIGRIVSIGAVGALVAVLLALAPALGVLASGTTDADDAQILFPITPCGVFDSRPNQGGAGKFTVNEDRPATLAGTAACPDVPIEATGFLISVIAIGAEGLGSVKVWPASEPEPGAGGVLAFSPNEFAPANTITVADGGDPNDVTVKVLSNPAHIKIVLLGYYLPGTDLFESFDRTTVVGATGTPAENGADLVAAAAAAGLVLPSADAPWTIALQPGTYELPASVDAGLTLPDHVDLVGAGSPSTHLVCDCGGIDAGGTNRISHLSLSPDNPAVAVASGGDVTLTDVAISQTTGTGINLGTSATLRLVDSTVATPDGLFVLAASTVEMRNSTVATSGTGIDIGSTAARILVEDSTIVGVDGIVATGTLGELTIRNTNIEAGDQAIVAGEDSVVDISDSTLTTTTAGDPLVEIVDTDGATEAFLTIDRTTLDSADDAAITESPGTGKAVVVVRLSTLLGTVDAFDAACQGVTTAGGTYVTAPTCPAPAP